MLDLTTHFDMVSKIVRSKFASYSYDSDDLIQDVCVKIHRQNLGSSPYDPALSSVPSYIYMVADGLVKKNWQRSSNDPMVTAAPLDDEYQDKAVEESHFDEVFFSLLEGQLKEESEVLADIFELTLQGFSRRDIVKVSPYTEHQIRSSRAALRARLREDLN